MSNKKREDFSKEAKNERPESWKSDVEELKEVLATIRVEVPGLLRSLIGPIKEFMEITYNPESAKERARAIATFYKELIEQGIPEDLALRLTREHFINPMSIVRTIIKGEEE